LIGRGHGSIGRIATIRPVRRFVPTAGLLGREPFVSCLLSLRFPRDLPGRNLRLPRFSLALRLGTPLFGELEPGGPGPRALVEIRGRRRARLDASPRRVTSPRAGLIDNLDDVAQSLGARAAKSAWRWLGGCGATGLGARRGRRARTVRRLGRAAVGGTGRRRWGGRGRLLGGW
jgi:hypothetical protein